MYIYKNELYFNTNNEQELLVLLLDWTTNPNYHYIAKLFQQYYEIALGDCNSSLMFKCLANAIDNYNKLDKEKATLQKYNTNNKSSNTQLQATLNKFAECNNVAKSKSIPRLASFLYNINYHLNLVVNVRSGLMIHVQVESAKCHKLEGSGHK
ncbi:7566_t:CDS:2 [Gigaspora margarita]|uniref:7566_t:CDS:1 n=1 Tax=Gigaspora margarita TaxID=4874 RepID=A0ABN7VGE8_GIGMA|nr:7566_t:CDS:2 [Gigaspora margarita]